jgi:hypothetical protein
MAIEKQGQVKRIAAVALGIICAWLVYHNLLAPARQGVLTSLPAAASSGSQPDASRQREGVARASSPRSPQPEKAAGRRGRAMEQEELAALDPTLRVELWEKVRAVEYEGSSRSIFQFYTPPPPKPVANPVLPLPPKPAQSSASPSAPPPANIPMKFYGVASRPGSSEKRAFLTEGDDIYVGQEGDVIDKNYKITRIGVNSIEMEDVRTKQRQTIPLVAE